MIRWLLDDFGDADDLVRATSVAGIHPYILLYQCFVLEFAVEMQAMAWLSALIYLFGYTTNFIAVLVVTFLIFITMFVGVCLLYSHSLQLLRWYSIRIKLIYMVLFCWGFAGVLYFDTGIIDRIISIAMIIIAIMFALEDKALVQVIYFEMHRYVGI
ncbi:unnamed protein product [Bursaphelenchus xylophilus]|uniref:(pine wood nematode) hypothetical protein n=1 Tax=Bursaphelenchus xylophilus TaxID=6326 RepID=A0A1I7SEQ9_BURXY|nr:unnamed protein product [Bursaphelenchus xylophilus]CAG9128264.1 unnamed protein product [Bursaphelenchus xylophilus]